MPLSGGPPRPRSATPIFLQYLTIVCVSFVISTLVMLNWFEKHEQPDGSSAFELEQNFSLLKTGLSQSRDSYYVGKPEGVYGEIAVARAEFKSATGQYDLEYDALNGTPLIHTETDGFTSNGTQTFRLVEQFSNEGLYGILWSQDRHWIAIYDYQWIQEFADGRESEDGKTIELFDKEKRPLATIFYNAQNKTWDTSVHNYSALPSTIYAFIAGYKQFQKDGLCPTCTAETPK